MPDSFEKRRRDQQKQRKRREKLERRVQRNADKNFSAGKAATMLHKLRRGETEHLTDADTWLCTLDIAAFHGWTPPKDAVHAPPGTGSYVRPAGLRVSTDDAQNLAQSLGAELPEISDQELPLTNQPFGEEHTQSLLARRVDGKSVGDDDIQAARELLSGSPKRDAVRLADFLKGGAFTVDP